MARGLRSVSKAAELRECEESFATGDGKEAGEVRRCEVVGLHVRALEISAGTGGEEEAGL